MTLDQVLNCKVLDLGYSYSSAKPSLVKEKVPEQVGLESQASLVKEMMPEQVGLGVPGKPSQGDDARTSGTRVPG